MSSSATLSPLLVENQVVNREYSRCVAQHLKLQPKLACKNALAAVASLIPTGTYVEGLVANSKGVPHRIYEHAWVQTPNSIVDPTPRHVSVSSEIAYFPVCMWSVDELTQIRKDFDGELMLPLSFWHPSIGFEHPLQAEALVAAHRHLSAVHLRNTGAPLYAPEREDEYLRALLDGRYDPDALPIR